MLSPVPDKVEEELASSEGFARRYANQGVLGAGGMGEVRLCRDARIGRDVALKVIRYGDLESRGDLLRRFLREARVQGQLEHPAIVPVYDVGRDADGAVYFTMKRIRGETLKSVLLARQRGEDHALREFTRHRLLTAFASVCLAVHFAHTRGVIHRDLKPANIMLGDFGEVYVLDWGLAKLQVDAEGQGARRAGLRVTPYSAEEDTTWATEHGTVLGTPGYMPPEQIENATLDARADVYALGAILFEILTDQPLYVRAPGEDLIMRTLEGVDARARERAPAAEVPPELEAICVRATHATPERRFATARAMHEELERFLHGDRDLERRRELSREHARAASGAADAALASAASDEGRRQALVEVSRALALDPTNADAMKTLVRLVTVPPQHLPPEILADLAAANVKKQRVFSRTMALASLGWFVTVPWWLYMGIANMPLAIAVNLLWAIAVVTGIAESRSKATGRLLAWTSLSTRFLALGGLSLAFGPFIVVPGIAAVISATMALLSSPARRRFALFGSVAVILVPALLEGAGLLPPSYAFDGHTLAVLPNLFRFPEVPTRQFLLLANVTLVVLPWIFVGQFRTALSDAEEKLQLTAWHLRQFVPGAAQGALPKE